MFEQSANSQPPQYKLVIFASIFLIFTIGIGMVFARMIAISQSSAIEKAGKPEFIPINVDNGSRELKGKVLPNFDTKIEATHRLLDDNSKLLTYIIANNDILKVSEGFNVTVIGTFQSMAPDQTEIIKVEKIKLK